MKALFASILMTVTSPAVAADWYFEASLEGGAEFWTFTNETGNVSPRRQRDNEIWITRTDHMKPLDKDGNCDFDNCTISVTLAGKSPVTGQPVSILFSNGESLDFTASSGEELMNNYATVGMAATNKFVQNIRKAEWVDIGFGDLKHRFALAGSTTALDAIKPYLSNMAR